MLYELDITRTPTFYRERCEMIHAARAALTRNTPVIAVLDPDAGGEDAWWAAGPKLGKARRAVLLQPRALPLLQDPEGAAAATIRETGIRLPQGEVPWEAVSYLQIEESDDEPMSVICLMSLPAVA